MAISAPTKTTQETNRTATPPVLNEARDHSDLKIAYGKLTFTSAGFTTASAGDLGLLRLPGGQIRIYGHLSRIICPIGTATSDLDLGWAAYNKEDGTTGSADGDGIAASLDVGGAAIDEDLDSVADVFEFNTKDGLSIVASFDTANSPSSGDLIILIAYTIGG
jgi:hypothetical protein